MNANEIIDWCKGIVGKSSSTPAESEDKMNSDKPVSASGSTTIRASGPVSATEAIGASGPGGQSG